jgi:hypothetical protein
MNCSAVLHVAVLCGLIFLPMGQESVRGAVFATPRQQYPSSRATPLIISEIMYHPPAVAGEEAEFVELFNTEPVTQDISGFRLGGQISFEFPINTGIPAKELSGGGSQSRARAEPLWAERRVGSLVEPARQRRGHRDVEKPPRFGAARSALR